MVFANEFTNLGGGALGVAVIASAACVGTPTSERTGVAGSITVGTRAVMAEVAPVGGTARLSSDALLGLLKPLSSFQMRLGNDATTSLRCAPGVAARSTIDFSVFRLRVDPTLPGSPTVTNAFLPPDAPPGSLMFDPAGSFLPTIGDPLFLSARGISELFTTPFNRQSLLNLGGFIQPVDLAAAARSLGGTVIACGTTGPGTFAADVSFCRDTAWPTADRPTAAPFEAVTGCGPTGWSTDSAGQPTLRIPWRVRVPGLFLNAFITCDERVTPSPSSVAGQLCPPLRGTCFGNSRTTVTLGARSPTQPIEFVLETNLTPVRCSRDGAAGVPRCPVFEGDPTLPSTPINLPNVALVPRLSISSIRTVDAAGNYGAPLSFTNAEVQSFAPDPLCRNLVGPALNGFIDLLLPLVEPFLLQLLAGPIQTAFRGNPDATPPEPGFFPGLFPDPGSRTTPVISPPTCALDARSGITIASSTACLQQWITYGLNRAAYRYITGPFNGPEGNNAVTPSWLWRNWRVDPAADPNRRRDLLVDVDAAPPNPGLLTCSNNGVLNPALTITLDRDGDGVPDACDNCPFVPNRSQNNCNRETERNLRRATFGVDQLGDACDPNPCATVREATPATTARLDGDRTGTSWFGRITTHPTVGSTDGTTPAASARTTEVTALRRCGCGSYTADGGWRADLSIAECIRSRCTRNGAVGAPRANDAFQLTDFRLRQSACIRRASDGRCDVREGETYLPEVTVASRAEGRAGRELDNRTSYEWDYKGEFLRGALVRGTEGLSEDTLRGIYIPSVTTFVWTRADRREGTSVPERLRDHYTPQADALALRIGSPPFELEFARIAPNLCLLVPRLCSPIPIRRLRGIANFVAPRPPLGQPKLHRFFTTLALDSAQVAAYPWLEGDRGELAPSVAALAVGVYDAESTQFTAIGPSIGDVPPFDGTSITVATGADGQPTLFALGGQTSAGISAFVYEGRFELSENGALTRWTKYPLPTGGDVAFGGPTPRVHAAVAASSDGRSVYVYGGQSSFGALHDLWKYSLADRTWEQVSLPVRPAGAVGASIAVDDRWLVIAGGTDDQGARSSQLVAVQETTGHFAQWSLSTPGVVDARIAIDRERVWMYGGSTDQGPSDQLVEVTLETGSVVRSLHTGVASASGAGFGVDPDGTISILPLSQPLASARNVALVGAPDALVALAERNEDGAPTCAASAASRSGLACQVAPTATSTLGTLACSGADVRCAASRDTSIVASRQGSAFALDNDFIAIANETALQVVLRTAPTIVVGEANERTNVRSVALSSQWLLSTTGRNVQWRALSSSALPVAGELETCGDLRSIRVVNDTLYADSTFGVERFRVTAAGVQRWPESVFASALDSATASQPIHAMDERGLAFCRGVSAFFRAPLERLRDRRSFDVTDDGVLWITQGALTFAFEQRTDGRLRVLATRRASLGPMFVRAVGATLATLSSDGTSRETLRIERNADGRASIRSLGAHELSDWITGRPDVRDETFVRRVDERIEIRRAH